MPKLVDYSTNFCYDVCEVSSMERSIGRMITLLARKSQSYFSVALDKYNLTAAEQPFFMTLRRQEGLTQEELTAIVCVDKAATARAVKSLEQKGYLIRRQDQRDRRQNRIYPTQRAKEIGEGVSQELLAFNAKLTQGIPQKDLDIVYKALLKMEENCAMLSGGKGKDIELGGRQNGTEQ